MVGTVRCIATQYLGQLMFSRLNVMRQVDISPGLAALLGETQRVTGALEILRHSGSQLEIGQILREALPEITPASLRKRLYLLYLLALINLRPASAP